MDDTITYEQPNQDVLESQKDERWYIQTIRYYSTFWNRPFPRLYDTQESVKNIMPVQDIWANNAYYQGEQANLSYNYLNGGFGTMQANWRNGQKVYSLVNNMVGTMQKVIEAIEPTTDAISRRAQNDRTRLIDDVTMRSDANDILDQIKDLGVEFQPVNKNIQFADEEEAQRWATLNYKDKAEEIGKDITDRLVLENRLKQKWGQKFKHCVISGLTATDNYILNGRQVAEIIMPDEIVWDNSVEDDFNSRASYRGYIKMYTPVEIRKKWGKSLSDTTLAEIDKLAKQPSSSVNWITNYNNANNFKWYDTTGTGGSVAKISVVKMYWYVVRDTRYKEKEIKYKEAKVSDITKKIDDTKDKNKVIPGDYGVVDICQGTLIGNRWLVDAGYVNNLVRDPNNRSNPKFPMTVFVPNMTQNRYRSVVGRLRELQDEADACGLKIRQLFGRDLGKNYIVYGDKLGISGAKELFQDFKAMNMSVVNGSTGEDAREDATTQKQLVGLIDLTLDPNVMRYAELKSLLQQEMEEIASIPKIALGQQTTVIGKGVQQETIQRSSLGNASLFSGFITHITEDTNIQVNQQRLAFAAAGNEDLAEMWVGESGLQFIKASDNFLLEDLGVTIDIDDHVDEAARMRLISYVQAWSQNPEFGLMPIDIVKLEKAKTFSEMIHITEYALKRGEATHEKQMAMQQMQQAAEMEKQAKLQQAMGEQQQQQVLTKEQGMNQRALIDADVKKGIAEQDNKTKIVTEHMAQGQPIE